MINDYRRVEWSDGGHQVFIVIAAIVLSGWIVRFVGGDPLLIFSSLYKALYIPSFGLSAIDLAAILLIASAGSSFAAEAGIYNAGAEGQFIAGFWVAGLVSVVSGAGATAGPIIGAAVAGTFLMRAVLSPVDDRVKDGQVVRGVLSTFLILVFCVPLLKMPVVSSFFPLLKMGSHPTSVIFLALALYSGSRYVLIHLQFGLSVKAGFDRLSPIEKIVLCFMSGGFCSIAGAALFLSGPKLFSSVGFIEGLGTLSFVLAFITRGRLWILLPFVSFLYAVIVMGWKPELMGGQTILTGAFSLLFLVSIVPLTMRRSDQ